jgi:hypothetical protein
MKRCLAVLAVLAAMALPAGHAAASLIEISLVPSQGRIDPPQNLFVDITISGLQSGGVDNLLGAWSMDLIYDRDLFVPLLIPPAGFGDGLGDVQSGQAVGGVDTTTPGTVGLFLVSLLFDFELDALQRDAAGNLLDGFTLATLGFFAPAGTGFTGLSTFIGTTNIVLADAFGNPLSDAAGAPIPIQHLPASIRVTEPATLVLLLLALGLIGWSASKRQLGPIARRVC